MKYKNEYFGITYFFPSILLPLWKRIFCKRNFHLFDEVWSSNDHYLYCDACGLIVNINDIDTEWQKKIK